MRNIWLLLVFFFGMFLLARGNANAQVCYPTRVINQYACVTPTQVCNQYAYRCAFNTSKVCFASEEGTTLGSCSAPGDGACTRMCLSWAPSGAPNCQQTGTQTVACNSASAGCQFRGTVLSCGLSGGTEVNCQEQNTQLTYSCWGPGNGGSGPTPQPGQWGNCGSCSCSSIGIGVDPSCRINDSGTCVWDPGGCPSGGSSCGQNGAVCTGWNDTTTCCAGLTCNKYDPSSTAYGSDRCGRCTDAYYIRLNCGATPETWCGQNYSCDNSSSFRCPDAQVYDIPTPPGSMSPADGTVLTGPQNTCGAACSDDIDCGANFVEARLNRRGGNTTKYRDMYLDAFREGGYLFEQTSPRVIYSRAFSLHNNAGFSGGSAGYTRAQNLGFTIGSLFSTVDIISNKSANSAYMDVYVNGGQYQSATGTVAPQISTNLNSVDSPPATYQYPVTVPFGSAKNFACTSGVCRLKNNPSSATCVDDPNLRRIDLVARPVNATANTQDFDAIILDGTTVQDNSSQIRYTGTWTYSGNPQYSGGSERFSRNAGDMVSFDTTATSITLVTTTSASRGSFDVLVDGVRVQTIVTTSATPRYQVQFPINLPPKVIASGTQQSVRLAWDRGVYNLFELQVYPEGRDCSDPAAFCGQVTRSNYRYVLTSGISTYVWRVRAINALCAFTNRDPVMGFWSNWATFTVDNPSDVTSRVLLDPGGGATLVGGVCQLAGASPYTGGGTVSVSRGSVTRTGTVSTVDGTYTVNAVPANTGYTITFAPTNPSYACTCPSTNCTYVAPPGVTIPTATNYPFFVSQIEDPWYQTVGGDIGALLPGVGNSVRSQIPQTTCVSPNCTPFFSLPNTPGNAATLGSLVVGSGSTVDLKDTTTGTQDNNVGQPSRLARLPSLFVPKENYDYFYRLYSLGLNPADDFTSPPQNPTNARKPNRPPVNGTDAYFRNGNLTIQNPWSLVGNDAIVVFVSGDLTINAPITLQTGTFVAFIVKGTITIGPSVGTNNFAATTNGQIQGFYLSDASITIPATTSGAELKLIAEGTFVARNGISIRRDFRNGGNGIANNSYPVVLFRYRPDLVRSVPARMMVPTVVWKEASP